MRLQELISELERVKNSSDVRALQDEKERLDKVLTKLRKAEEFVGRLKANLEACRSYNFEEVSRESVGIIEALINVPDDPEALGELVEELFERSQKCVDTLNQLKERVLAEYKKRVEELNRKIMVYARIFRNVLREEVEVEAFEVKDDIEEARKEVERAEDMVTQLNKRLKEKLESSNLPPEYVDVLVDMVDKGEVTLTKRNKERFIKVVEFLVEMGVPVKVRV
ncbi:MAG: hypothetical protein MPF33_09965 [Candidatus Aramenus sp.]|jgi:Na+/phosphate symporter|nr:hypothetical protein [Candidatus Aramenus sp.]